MNEKEDEEQHTYTAKWKTFILKQDFFLLKPLAKTNIVELSADFFFNFFSNVHYMRSSSFPITRDCDCSNVKPWLEQVAELNRESSSAWVGERFVL